MKKNVYLLIILCLNTFFLSGQINFNHFNGDQGLSHYEVKSILQDSYGYIWVGTRNKLNRYDGSEFKLFDCFDPVSNRRNNNISALFEDDQRHLWVGTDKGVFIYDPAREDFTALERWLKHPIDIAWDWVENITLDKDNNMWIVMPNCGVLRVNTQNKEAKLYQVVKQLKPSYSNPQCLAIDYYGTVWVGCNGSGIYKYDKKQDTFKPVAENNVAFLGKDIYAICHYENYLFVGLHQGELLKYNKVTGEILSNEYPNVNNQIIRCLSVQNDKELWVGTNNGLHILNLFNKDYSNIKEDTYDPNSISNNTITCIYKDKEGGIWIGTMYGGLNYLNNNSKDFTIYTPNSRPNSIQSKWVHGLYLDQDTEKLWIGTEYTGYSIYDLKSKAFSEIKGAGKAQVACIEKINGNIWIGFFKRGLDIITPDMNVKHYDSKELGLNESSVYSLCQDRAGNVWLGDAWGMYQAPKGSMNFKRVDLFGLGFIHDIHEDRDGNIWAATIGNGIYRYEPHIQKISHYTENSKELSISSNCVSDILEDSKGRIWFSTDRGGIMYYTKQSNSFKTYSVKDGLPDDVTFKAVEDTKGNIWFGTNHGLVRLNPDDGQIKVFNAKDGLKVSRFNYNSAVISNGGHIYMGTTDGLISFNPNKFAKNNHIPPVYFTNFSVGGSNILPNAVNAYPDDFNIFINYNQGNIAIRFAALSFTTPAANKYAYKMDNIDAEWVYTDKNIVSYAKLAPGNYKFRIKGANNMGKWNDTEKVLTIRVLPPWWASNIAYVSYLIIILSLICFLFWMYSRRNAKKNEEKKLIYTIEKEKELYDSKLNFFTNITHEIRTPLTLINGPLEIMLEETGELPSKAQRYLGIIKQNVDQLLDLVNQLLDFRAAGKMNVSLNFTEIPVLSFFDELKNRFSISLSKQNKELNIDTAELSKDLSILADKSTIDKIMNNLLFNAIKYSNKNISLIINNDTEYLTIRLINDGQLIPSETRDKVFNPFVRAENCGDNIGTGIGLSLCRTLTEQHHGVLHYEESEGLNCFVLRLPVKQHIEKVKEEEIVSVNNEQIVEEEIKASSTKITLLIVEDNVNIINFLTEQLHAGYNVLTASDGLIALQIIKENRVDLVLSDVMMPNMDGLTLCQTLKSNIETSHIITVLLTSRNDINCKIKGLEAGADAYVEKPFNLNYLMALLKNLIANKNRERNLFSSKPLIPIGHIEMNKTDELFMNRVIEIINNNISDPAFNVESLTNTMCMSHSNFSRKLKAIVNMNPSDFIRLMRLKRAASIISEGDYRINEVSMMIGINSTSNFIQMFQKQFGKTPNEFKKECLEKTQSKDIKN